MGQKPDQEGREHAASKQLDPQRKGGGKTRHPKRSDRLDVRIRKKRLGARLTRSVARKIAELHADPPSASPTQTPISLAHRSRAAIGRMVDRGTVGEAAAEDLRQRQEEHLRTGVSTLLERFEAHCVRPLHGDLRCATVWVDDRRHVSLGPRAGSEIGDPALDLGSLCADLRALRASAQAEKLISEYLFLTDDYGLLRGLDFYERLRASELAAEAEAGGAGKRAHALAAVATDGQSRRSPLVVAIGGRIASGKSTLARKLARRSGTPRVVADRIRKALFESRIPEDLSEEAQVQLAWQRTVAPGLDGRVYDGLRSRAGEVLATGRSVVVDACFATRHSRQRVAELAADHGAAFVFVECRAPRRAIRGRLQHRDLRDGRPEGSWRALADRIDLSWEPVAEEELGSLLPVDTDRPPGESVANLIAALPGLRTDPSN